MFGLPDYVHHTGNEEFVILRFVIEVLFHAYMIVSLHNFGLAEQYCLLY